MVVDLQSSESCGKVFDVSKVHENGRRTYEGDE